MFESPSARIFFDRIRRALIGVAIVFFLAAIFELPLLSPRWRTGNNELVTITLMSEVFLHDSQTQWIVVVCFTACFILFLMLDAVSPHPRKNLSDGTQIYRTLGKSNLWLVGFATVILFPYVRDYARASRSLHVVILIGGILAGKMMVPRIQSQGREARREWLERISCWIYVFCSCAMVVSFWQQESGGIFYYWNVQRRGGPWQDPNLFGTLMALGIILAAGRLFYTTSTKYNGLGRNRFNDSVRGKIYSEPRWMLDVILAGSLICCAFGLVGSLSRGAWLGAGCGLGILLRSYFRFQPGRFPGEISLNSSRRQFIIRNCKYILILGVTISAICFWSFRNVEIPTVRRIFSFGNINDFSWRNRLTSWAEAFRLIQMHPLGLGWNRATLAYANYDTGSHLKNPAAIQSNDYLLLGISAGVPAIVCFLLYVGLSLRSPRPSVHSPQQTRGPDFVPEASEDKQLEWLQATCRAGAIVLLVGFFFDGGLFKFATGSVFWILLELGRVDRYRVGAGALMVPDSAKETAEPKSTEFASSFAPTDKIVPPGPPLLKKLVPWEIWLRRATWILGIVAIFESAILLATPFFGVNDTTLAISRHYLVPPSAVADLNLLATNVDWSSRKLRPLLQHASLANYNRQLINWKLDDAIYRDYVLNPSIDPARDGQLAWRRKLWEYFYLPMRKENDPAGAAQIVLKFLHQRIATVPAGPATIDEMWLAKQADEKGIQALEVAAFRSVGIPARLTDHGQAELFSDGKWQVLPEYPQPAPQSGERR